MTFRPSPLAYALAVAVAWTVCLAIVLDRVELFFVAVPLVVRFMRSPTPARTDVRDFALTSQLEPRVEGEELTVAISARMPEASGPVEVLPVLPPLLLPRTQRTVTLAPQPDGSVLWNARLLCRATGTLDFGAVFFRLWDRAGLWLAEFPPGTAHHPDGLSPRGDHPHLADAAADWRTIRNSYLAQAGRWHRLR